MVATSKRGIIHVAHHALALVPSQALGGVLNDLERSGGGGGAGGGGVRLSMQHNVPPQDRRWILGVPTCLWKAPVYFMLNFPILLISSPSLPHSSTKACLLAAGRITLSLSTPSVGSAWSSLPSTSESKMAVPTLEVYAWLSGSDGIFIAEQAMQGLEATVSMRDMADRLGQLAQSGPFSLEPDPHGFVHGFKGVTAWRHFLRVGCAEGQPLINKCGKVGGGERGVLMWIGWGAMGGNGWSTFGVVLPLLQQRGSCTKVDASDGDRALLSTVWWGGDLQVMARWTRFAGGRHRMGLRISKALSKGSLKSREAHRGCHIFTTVPPNLSNCAPAADDGWAAYEHADAAADAGGPDEADRSTAADRDPVEAAGRADGRQMFAWRGKQQEGETQRSTAKLRSSFFIPLLVGFASSFKGSPQVGQSETGHS
ncbi:hypothetical protein BDK51DRAFT_33883 [Blyttiomyces helicus]|uniref:Uncharacterized protein n=1 Tax=Blyttiomyces helicus TaxID=388810 RepID=A0A4P9WNN6_9FUNG|nr:hypothetical protein BDK51DRAFT_33883 [Blyttiomyces helicus]|eukprot:RKO94594.1 hypothetical protein BDK51DRAFT_33883 [Blyttiomyces helicus]